MVPVRHHIELHMAQLDGAARRQGISALSSRKKVLLDICAAVSGGGLNPSRLVSTEVVLLVFLCVTVFCWWMARGRHMAFAHLAARGHRVVAADMNLLNRNFEYAIKA